MLRKISLDILRNANSSNSLSKNKTITPTGGNEVKVINGYSYHLFTGAGTFNTGFLTSVEVTMIAGGGGGGNSIGGGGGGGGWMPWRQVKIAPNTAISVTVGSGGNSGSGTGGDSSFVGTNATLTVKGGGSGGQGYAGGGRVGGDGGSGGGAAAIQSNTGTQVQGGKNIGSYMGRMGGYGVDNVGNQYGAGGGGGVISVGGNVGGTGGEGANLSTYLGSDVTTLSTFSGHNVIGSGGGGSKNGTNYAGGTGGGNAGAANMYGAGGGGGNNSSGAGYQGFVLVRWKI